MIKLIACDIDGTLLHGVETAISAPLLEEFRRLREKEIPLCAASGRQHGNLRRLFGPLSRDMYFLCENGALIVGPGEGGTLLRKTALPHTDALRLCNQILALPGCELMISGEDTSYLCPKGPVVLPHVRDFVGNRVAVLAAPGDMPEDIIKISVFCPDGVAAAAALPPLWEAQLNVAVAGAQWVDFTPANKGDGIRQLCEILGLSPCDVMAFGDNYNDLPMLDIVGHPYIMDNAAAALRSRFPNHCARVSGVTASI